MKSSDTPNRPGERARPWSRGAVVAAVVAFTTGLSGYFMGIQQVDRLPSRTSEVSSYETTTAEHAPEAPHYRELQDRTWQTNAAWRSKLSRLTSVSTEKSRSMAELDAQRVERRAFRGAPPTVPHPVDQRDSAACLACHGTPTRVGLRDVPQVSHPAYSQCLQCHAPKVGPSLDWVRLPKEQSTPPIGEGFGPWKETSRGTRAHASAPPVTAHSTAMRQNCTSCHGPGGSSILKPTHLDRQNCLQCHPLQAPLENIPLVPLVTAMP